MTEAQIRSNKIICAIAFLLGLMAFTYSGTCKEIFFEAITHNYFPTICVVVFIPLMVIDIKNEFSSTRSPISKVEKLGHLLFDHLGNAVLAISSLSLVKILALQSTNPVSIFDKFTFIDQLSLFISAIVIFLYALFKTINSYQRVFTPNESSTYN